MTREAVGECKSSTGLKGGRGYGQQALGAIGMSLLSPLLSPWKDIHMTLKLLTLCQLV